MMSQYHGPASRFASVDGLGQSAALEQQEQDWLQRQRQEQQRRIEAANQSEREALRVWSAARGRRESSENVAKGIAAITGIAASSALAYHGYKRNNSVGWAIGWFFFGALWPISVPVALAQGFAKPAVKKNRRSRSK
jgi:hypothetical protein